MSISLDVRDRELLEFIHQNAGVEILNLCSLLGVTRTAVRQRLSRLESSGLISSNLRGQGRGRPKLIYSVTAEGLHALGENYQELAVVFWEAISGFEDPKVRERLIFRVRDALADRFRPQLAGCDSVDERVDYLAEEMKSSGFNVESDRTGGLRILRETSCPFPLLADVDETICQVEREVFQQVLGVPVRFRSRCRDGHGCCEFQVMEPAAAAVNFDEAIDQGSETAAGD